jgi:hypothetical protein
MKIGLIDVDGRHFPNLALMKLSAHHKACGDRVEWVNYFEKYDTVYMSKVFTFTPDVTTCINAGEVVRGGTGYGMYNELPLEIDAICPDYSIYPQFEHAYGFLTRGCIRNCPWCIVPKKEGYIIPYCFIDDVLQGRKSAVLMDNNILAHPWGLEQIERIIKLGCRVDFNQGLDARLVTDEVACMLAKVRWIQYIRFALDTKIQLDPLDSAISKLNRYGVPNGVPNSKIFVYVLLHNLQDSYDCLAVCKNMKVKPFAQPYRNLTPNQIIPQWQRDMARWCNRMELFNSTDFKDYSPRKGFKCAKYFNEK